MITNAEWQRLKEMVSGLVQGDIDLNTETYTYEWPGGSATWNIAKAKQCILDGRAAGWNDVPRDQLQIIADRYEYDEAKVTLADPSIPGIAAPILDQDQVVYVIVDGIHRAVRAYRDGQPFIVLILSDSDSRTCILGSWEGLVP